MTASDRHFVRQDAPDLRDWRYQPSLAVLRPQLVPVPSQLPARVRNQANTPRCTGHALAALIDVQRRAQQHQSGAAPDDEMVSADMLYWMGAYHDDPRGARPDGAETGLRSLRSVLKGFYHHGVCLDIAPGTAPPDADGRWPSGAFGDGRPETAARTPTVAQARAARQIGLGAFYRIEPVLNDYHAALNDTGAILVSAVTHPGWDEPSRPGVVRIGPPHGGGADGAHAFVIVGYAAEGFLVLNSWGPGWGGYAGLPGVALWPYADWADSVMDGWVLRLAVSAPEAFDVAAGPQGWQRSWGGPVAAAPRGHQLIGHYLHLDDGFHVERGAFPSDEDTWPRTRQHLRTALGPADLGSRRTGLLLWIPGSVEGLEPAARAAVQRKPAARELGLYPYAFFWSHLFVDKSVEVLTTVFDSCLRRVGTEGPDLDALIETELRGIGRAFWRDIELSAQRAVCGPTELPAGRARRDLRPAVADGPLLGPFRDMLDLARQRGCALHVVTEGAGVLVLHELLAAVVGRERARRAELAGLISTLALIHPAIDVPRARLHLLPLIAAMNTGPAGAAPPRARIHHLAPELAARCSFGAYRGPILQLVARAFEDRLAPESRPARDPSGRPRPATHPDNPPRVLLGTAEARPMAAAGRGGGAIARAFCALTGLADPRHATGRVPHAVLTADPTIPARVFDDIRAWRRDAPPPRPPRPDPS